MVAVGGTTLSRNPTTGAYIFESAWNSTGGGLSQYETIPSYQKGVAKMVGMQRGVPDIAAEADPNSGLWVFDSGNGGWYIVGGTSASSPIWAGVVSAAGNNAGSSAAELTTLYRNRANKTDFNDIKSGVCGPWNGNLTQAGTTSALASEAPLAMVRSKNRNRIPPVSTAPQTCGAFFIRQRGLDRHHLTVVAILCFRARARPGIGCPVHRFL